MQSQKQIIKQLKYLIAKQQVEINSLHNQLISLKRFLSSSQYEKYQQNISQNDVVQIYAVNRNENKLLQRQDQAQQQFDSGDSYDRDQNSSRSIQKVLGKIHQQLQKFYNSTYITVKQKYYTNQHQKQRNKKQLPNKLPKKFTNIQRLIEFFPSFIQQINSTFIQMNHQIEKYKQQQISLSKKIISQQKALKQIIAEYEKNIHQSQIIEQKLLKQINILQVNNSFNQKQKTSQNKFYNLQQADNKHLKEDFYQA